MKLGIVGSGTIVQMFLKNVKKDNIELKAICTTANSQEKGKQIQQEYGIDCAYCDYDEFLKSQQFDVVYLGIPNHIHYTYCKKALEAGKNVILEKPFASNYLQAKALVDLAIKKNLYLFEAISMIHNPNHQKTKQLVESLGEIKIVSLNYSQYSSRYDAFKQGIIKPAFDYTKSGGALMDLNVYNIHFVVGIFGAPIDVHYYANISNNIDTSGILILDYGSFKASLIASKDCDCKATNTIQGDKGAIFSDAKANTYDYFCYKLNKQETLTYNLCNNEDRMQFEFDEFIRILEEKDYQKMKDLLSESLVVMDILTKARLEANIVFTNESL